ncbi:MAG: ubiquinone/menaquinone biosynthesis methyltransferase [Gemmatimonadaceae bacterium]
MHLADRDLSEALAAASGRVGKRAYVRQIFSEIAPRYDLLNHLLSFNVDRSWRRHAIAELGWERRPGATYLDVCAGTLDVGNELARTPGFRGHVVGADFAEPMVRAGRKKTRGAALSPIIGDTQELPVAGNKLAGAIVAFGVRNLADLDAGLRELHRVLAYGARLVILEFSTPPSMLVRAVYHTYFHLLLPVIGRLVSGHPTAYRYLPESVARFPTEHALAQRLELAGFSNVRWRRLSFGIAAIHVGEKGGGEDKEPIAG